MTRRLIDLFLAMSALGLTLALAYVGYAAYFLAFKHWGLL